MILTKDYAGDAEPALGCGPYSEPAATVSPDRKQDTAKMLGKAARYIDIAVLAPIHPARDQTLLLISGPDSPHVRFRSLADIEAPSPNVRFVPKADNRRWVRSVDIDNS